MSCCASGCGFEEGSARCGAGTGKLPFSKTARSGAPAVLDVTSDGVGDVLSDAASNVVGEGVVVSSEGGGKEGAVPGTIAERAVALALNVASDLPAHFEFGCGKFSLALELALRLAARLEFDLELLFLLTVSSALAANLEPEFAIVSAAAD